MDDHGLRRLSVLASGALWLGFCAAGLGVLVRHQAAAGSPGVPPARWPAGSRLARDPQRSTLLLFAHPRCPCTRASLDSLAWAMARGGGKVRAYAVFLKPSGAPAGWERTDLWDAAAAIPGVEAVGDEDAAEAGRFGAETSGQVLLYGAGGTLRFSGGITGARGHFGDNAARDAVVALLAEGPAPGARSRVFGCALRGPGAPAREDPPLWKTWDRTKAIARL